MLQHHVGECEPLIALQHKPEMEDRKGQEVVDSTPSLSEDAAAPPVIKGALDPVYQGKAQTLNAAIQDIGQ